MSDRNRLLGRLAMALVAALLALSTAFTLPSWNGRGSPATAGSKGRIVLAWGVGGVLTDDGTLWQFRPESRHWVTVDQSFALDGERRKVLPLPVPAGEIAHMEGFGFLVTRGGSAWLYNLDTNAWENIGAPGR